MHPPPRLFALHSLFEAWAPTASPEKRFFRGCSPLPAFLLPLFETLFFEAGPPLSHGLLMPAPLARSPCRPAFPPAAHFGVGGVAAGPDEGGQQGRLPGEEGRGAPSAVKGRAHPMVCVATKAPPGPPSPPCLLSPQGLYLYLKRDGRIRTSGLGPPPFGRISEEQFSNN